MPCSLSSSAWRNTETGAPSERSEAASSTSRASASSRLVRASTDSWTEVSAPGSAVRSSLTTNGTPALRRWSSRASHCVSAASSATAPSLRGASRRRRRAWAVARSPSTPRNGWSRPISSRSVTISMHRVRSRRRPAKAMKSSVAASAHWRSSITATTGESASVHELMSSANSRWRSSLVDEVGDRRRLQRGRCRARARAPEASAEDRTAPTAPAPTHRCDSRTALGRARSSPRPPRPRSRPSGPRRPPRTLRHPSSDDSSAVAFEQLRVHGSHDDASWLSPSSSTFRAASRRVLTPSFESTDDT